MKEIKFRAWQKLNSEWAMLSHFWIMNTIKNTEYGLEDIGNLMQFTGLKDKNGKEIYEGDVMRSGNGRIWTIKYGDWKYYELKQLTPMFGWFAESNDDPSGTTAQLPLRSDVGGFMEVIGNIFENPELLREA